MVSLKNHKGLIIFSSLLGAIIVLIIYSLFHFNTSFTVMGSPNSFNMLFLLIILAFIIIEFAFIYYWPKRS